MKKLLILILTALFVLPTTAQHYRHMKGNDRYYRAGQGNYFGLRITDKGGRKYAYRNYNFWDKEKKAPRTWREYLGRVDENGNIIPKKTKRSDSRETSTDDKNSSESESTSSETRTEERLRILETQMADLTKTVNTLVQILKEYNTQVKDSLHKLDALD